MPRNVARQETPSGYFSLCTAITTSRCVASRQPQPNLLTIGAALLLGIRTSKPALSANSSKGAARAQFDDHINRFHHAFAAVAQKRPMPCYFVVVSIKAVTDIICESIRKRVLLEFEYGGHPRVVVPYCHGISTRNAESLRAVQVRGNSASGGFGFGKLWTVAKMTHLRLTNETFVPNDPNYNPNDSGMKEIHCRI